ncbi:phage protein Gp27 family protein [Hungatella effluvii]|uniref:phage protein Gp27 family protein n=1 Tax=Hungatella effluvii TaxID=1096246 RepID=UPI0022E060B0|nr:phage protein Gp27 family protein [Hungatella effluvii]
MSRESMSDNTERRRSRVSSSIDKLPEEIKGQLDRKLLDTANTYSDLAGWLKDNGYEISRSAIGRYAIRSSQAAQRVAETLQRTQAIAAAVEAHPDLDYTKAASMVLMDGLMQRVSTAEEDFQELPLDKAGRLIASLSRAATYEKKVRQDMKRKAELAFEQLETELMAAIKQDQGLAGELHAILTRAREKVIPDED